MVRCLLHNWSVAAWRWRPRVAPFEYRIYCETENIFPGTANLQTLVRPPAMKEWHRGAAILALQWGQFREKSTSGPFIGPPTRGNVSNERSLQWGRAVRRASLLRTIGVGDVSFAPRNLVSVKSSRRERTPQKGHRAPGSSAVLKRETSAPLVNWNTAKLRCSTGSAAGELRNQATVQQFGARADAIWQRKQEQNKR